MLVRCGRGSKQSVHGSERKAPTKLLTFISRVCVHMNGEAAGTVEAFGAVRTCVPSPAVRLLVSRGRG